MLFVLVVIVTIDAIQEAMHKFLESEGVLATKDYFPDEPDEERVKAYEEHGLLGLDPSAPHICSKQTFRGKWNKEVVEILATKFIVAVKKGTYQPIQHTWPQMNEDKVRKRCQSKLYRTQRICLNPKTGPESDKVNWMYQRWQEVHVFPSTPSRGSLIFSRHITEGEKSTTRTTIMTQRHGKM